VRLVERLVLLVLELPSFLVRVHESYEVFWALDLEELELLVLDEICQDQIGQREAAVAIDVLAHYLVILVRGLP